MDSLFFVFLGSFVSLVVCIAAGFICRKVKILDDSLIAGLTNLLVKVTLPCTVFISMMRPFSQTLLLESAATFFLSILAFGLGGLLGLGLNLWIKPKKSEKNVFIFALIFSNVGYMGFPVISALYGDAGTMYTSMINASFHVLLFTLGVRMFNPHTPAGPAAEGGGKKGQSLKMIALNPALIATVIGFIFFLTGLRLPQPVNDGIGFISAMTTPVSMMLVGAILAKKPLRDLFTDWRALPILAIRLMVLPLIVYAVLRVFIRNPVMLGVIVVLTAMPVASITVIFAERYRADTALASKLVALSTLISVIAVPALALLLGII